MSVGRLLFLSDGSSSIDDDRLEYVFFALANASEKEMTSASFDLNWKSDGAAAHLRAAYSDHKV